MSLTNPRSKNSESEGSEYVFLSFCPTIKKLPVQKVTNKTGKMGVVHHLSGKLFPRGYEAK
jgi:hypothetical protein